MKRAFSRKNLWEKAPRPMKAALGLALSFAPLEWLLGGRFRAWRRFLREAQWWSAEQIREYQTNRVREMLTLAYEKTVYYRRAFREIGFEPGDLRELSDLQRLPRIDKTTLREHAAEMMTAAPNGRGVDYVTTAGSSGTPLAFHIGAERSAVEFAHLTLCWERVGYRPGMSMAVLRGQEPPVSRAGFRYAYDPLLRHHVYSSFDLTETAMRWYVTHMNRVRPAFLHAYPSSAYTLTRFMAEHGLRFPDSLRAILLESEPLHTHQRQFIERHFDGLRVYSSYGHTEKLILAAECEHSSAYHVWPTYGYGEVVDHQGREVAEGELGELVGTGFINQVTPFIRYRTDDFAVRGPSACTACGRQHALITGMQAHRSQEFLIGADGRAIVWTALNMHDDTFDGVRQFQLIQERPGAAELLLTPGGAGTFDQQRVVRNLERKLGGQVALSVRVVDRIPPEKSGKQPIIRQRTPEARRAAPTPQEASA